MDIMNVFQEYLNVSQIKKFIKDEKDGKKVEWYVSSDSSCRLGVLCCELQEVVPGTAQLNIALPVKAYVSRKEEMTRVAEFLTRVNFELAEGSFLMNWETGALSFRYTIPALAGQLTSRRIEYCADYALDVINIYGNALLSVLLGEIAIKDCVASCSAVSVTSAFPADWCETEESTPAETDDVLRKLMTAYNAVAGEDDEEEIEEEEAPDEYDETEIEEEEELYEDEEEEELYEESYDESFKLNEDNKIIL